MTPSPLSMTIPVSKPGWVFQGVGNRREGGREREREGGRERERGREGGREREREKERKKE